ncbi:MAG: citrate/2-methylcitrate synthase [Candidatus Micrarchaeota archaeon]
MEKKPGYRLFDANTRAIVYGMQAQPVQRMLDFDWVCRRKTPSVAAVVDPNGKGVLKVFFGPQEILIPVFQNTKDAVAANSDADVFVNFASFRSAFQTSMEALTEKSIRTVTIIAEGVPERRSRELIAEARKLGKTIIGPATVGGISAGAFRIANSGGTIENIIACKLHRKGSAGLVSKSGGLLNEKFNVIARNSDGAAEGIAIGGDRFPGSTLLEHALRYEEDPDVKMIVVLGELGGTGEYEVADAIKAGKIRKPVVAWVTGTCAAIFPSEVQFGHAGAKSGSHKESAQEKNKALKEAGAIVPASFDGLGDAIKTTFEGLKKKGVIREIEEPEPPRLPVDHAAALKTGLVRKPTGFVASISDERGTEVMYNGVPISKVVGEGMGIGDVIGLLWFKKRLPPYASKFVELCLIISADHGPAVSGAHNTIVASRAGKDVISSLCSGLLTIGPRFGGALDDAARYFKEAKDSGMAPQEFVDSMKKKGVLIPGIGHRIKSVQNPDERVTQLKEYAKKHFKSTKYLDYALEVEKITTGKRNNLILNVDGCMAVLWLDLLTSCGEFSEEEVKDLAEGGFFNGLFALGRSIGLIGHALDQKRLKQPLYRHPWDDILFVK